MSWWSIENREPNEVSFKHVQMGFRMEGCAFEEMKKYKNSKLVGQKWVRYGHKKSENTNLKLMPVTHDLKGQHNGPWFRSITDYQSLVNLKM